MHNQIRLLSTTVCLLFFSLSAFAQKTYIISGKVTDDRNAPMPGVNIVQKGTTKDTLTDDNGQYKIDVTEGGTLVFSFVGMVSQEFPVSSSSALNVSLASDAKALGQLVVVGYGTRKKSDLTGAISQIDAKDFKEQSVTRFEDALQGRAAGVTVSRSSGSPGGEIKVRIRGINSISGNNDPLVVVDGIIGSDLSSLNPNDIASIDVLKDASATAIYGSRGSNGVIIISTKKGTSKPTFNVEYFTSSSTIPKMIPTLNTADFATLENARRIRTGGTAIFSDADIAALKTSGGTNYQDAILQKGISQNLQVSASGKTGKVNYFMSGNYMNQNGVLMTTGYRRMSGRINLSTDITNKLKIGFNLFATTEKTHNNIDDSREFEGSVFLRALTYDPTTPIKDAIGNFNNYSLKSLAHLGYNPFADMITRDDNRHTDKVNANINVSYDILKDLNFTAVGGLSTLNFTSESYNTKPPLPNAYFGSGRIDGYQLSNILTWSKKMGIHDLKLTGLYEIQEGTYRGNAYGANNILVPGGFYIAELNLATGIFNDYIKTGIESVMARAEYILKDNLLVTGTIRRDRSSRFREGKDVGVFPSVAVAYNLSNMAFITYGGIINALKLRAGWGQVGNQNVAPYSTYPSVNINRPYLFNGSTLSPGSSPGGYGNPDLTWETTAQSNVGIDLSLFKNRVILSIDAYQKNTTNLLLYVPVPDFAGGGTIPKNVGEVQNKGIDIHLDGTIAQKGDFIWRSIVTTSFVKNKVVKLDGREQIIGTFNNIDGSGRALNVIQVGQALGQFYGETFLGTWKTADATEAAKYGEKPGDSRYKRDEQGNIILGAIGNGTPTFSWGFNNAFSYKGFDANIFFSGMGGYQILNVVNGMLVGATGNQRSFLSPVQLNQWSATNQTDIPVGGQNRTASSRYVEKGDFARLSNLSIGYTITFIPRIPTLKVYVSGQNLLLLTKFSGYDPEGSDKDYGNGNNDAAAGVNVGAYPNPRVVTFGIKIEL